MMFCIISGILVYQLDFLINQCAYTLHNALMAIDDQHYTQKIQNDYIAFLQNRKGKFLYSEPIVDYISNSGQH